MYKDHLSDPTMVEYLSHLTEAELSDPTTNVFGLFVNHPDWREVEARLKAACAKAVIEINAIRSQHADCGAEDSDVRYAIGNYFKTVL